MIKTKIMSGLQRICRMYGGMIAKDKDGKEVEWMWDYANEKPRIKKEMTKEEIKASEKERYQKFMEQLKISNNDEKS